MSGVSCAKELGEWFANIGAAEVFFILFRRSAPTTDRQWRTPTTAKSRDRSTRPVRATFGRVSRYGAVDAPAVAQAGFDGNAALRAEGLPR